jgi:hypothetical protein
MLSGTKVLALRNYGIDIKQRLEFAGFQAEIRAIDDQKHAIEDAKVMVCKKLEGEHLQTEKVQQSHNHAQGTNRKA